MDAALLGPSIADNMDVFAALALETNGRDPNHRVLAEARERLSGERDARGRRLEIVPLPMPAPVVFAKQRLPASYANFYVSTGAVLVPTFNDPQDRVALGVIAELFPDRDIVGVYSRDLVLGLGTLHCSTLSNDSPACTQSFIPPARTPANVFISARPIGATPAPRSGQT